MIITNYEHNQFMLREIFSMLLIDMLNARTAV
ncbi:hypothetical protein NVI2019_PEGOAJLN_01532 [Providencia alcalifaciens]|nr:hypothetical protein NVI2019_PEGOAJLN_01532 [Providencia alcalifaciens]